MAASLSFFWLVFLALIVVGLIIVISAVRANSRPLIRCSNPRCRAKNRDDADYCSHCGAQLRFDDAQNRPAA